jgi:ABC-2 type transport system permease protein
MLCGIVMQTIAGYYHYELLQYFKELYIVTFPQVLAFALLALFVQTVVSNKFIGHGIVIGIFVLVPSCSASAGRTRSTCSATRRPTLTRT